MQAFYITQFRIPQIQIFNSIVWEIKFSQHRQMLQVISNICEKIMR